MVIPEKRVNISPNSGINEIEINLAAKKPPTRSPMPAPSSPYDTIHQTKKGRPKASASSPDTGNFERPCWMKTIAKGTLNNQ